MRFAVNVRGKTKEWSFEFEGREEDWKTWTEDGLDVERVGYSVPSWVVDMGILPILEAWYRLWHPQEGGF